MAIPNNVFEYSTQADVKVLFQDAIEKPFFLFEFMDDEQAHDIPVDFSKKKQLKMFLQRN